MQKKANVCPLKCNAGLFVIVVGLAVLHHHPCSSLSVFVVVVVIAVVIIVGLVIAVIVVRALHCRRQ